MNDVPETVEQFLARGQKIERLPIGQCNWDALSNRAKINPQILPSEMAAKRKAERAEPLPRAVKVLATREPQKRTRDDFGYALVNALATLVDGDTTTRLAERLGKKHAATYQLLTRLEAKKKVRRKPWQGKTTWHRAP